MGNLGLPREKTRVELSLPIPILKQAFIFAYLNLAIGPVVSQRGYVEI